jgi:hypothetical protein
MIASTLERRASLSGCGACARLLDALRRTAKRMEAATFIALREIVLCDIVLLLFYLGSL